MKSNNIAKRGGSFLRPLTVVVSALILAPSLAFAAFSPISSQLDFGESNGDVTKLQTFLAANPSIYPQGLVTGYYGSLTVNAVKAFQNFYGLSPVGRVGPLTIAKINELIANGSWGNGGGSVSGDATGPQFTSLTNTIAQTSATFTWSTNENATAKVFYNTSPVRMNEGDINSVGFGATSGLTGGNDNQLRTTQTVTVAGLQPNTVYYYTLVSTDANGNVSVWNPNTTFRTSF